MDSHAPRYLPPVVTAPGPKGLPRSASFHCRISRAGTTWVFIQCTRATPFLDPHPLPPFHPSHRTPKNVDEVRGEARA
eukprot:6092744-Lingulodinium_polyedra.AAC.1